MFNNQIFGKSGEDFACDYLRKNGYKILQRNFKSKLGEIDIIALDSENNSLKDKTLVFIEVKTRHSKEFGEPQEAVTSWKIKSIIKTGEYYKMLHPQLPEALRIDVVAISMADNCFPQVNLIKNITG